MKKRKSKKKKFIIVCIFLIIILLISVVLLIFRKNKVTKVNSKHIVSCDKNRNKVMENLALAYNLSSDAISFEEENPKFIRYKFIDNNEVKYFYFYKKKCSTIIKDIVE